MLLETKLSNLKSSLIPRAGPRGEPRPREALHPAEAVLGHGTPVDVRAHLVGRRLVALRRRRPPLLHLLDLARHRSGEHASGKLDVGYSRQTKSACNN